MAVEYTDIGELKDWLGVGNTADDQKLTGVLLRAAESAESQIRDYCGRETFLTATRTEYFTPGYAAEIVLRHTPVTAVTSVGYVTGVTALGVETTQDIDLTRLSVDGFPIGAAFTAYTGVLAFRAGYEGAFVAGEPLVVLPSYVPCPNFGDGTRRVKVVYTGGYADAAAVPSALKQAAIELAAVMVKRSGQYAALRPGGANESDTPRSDWKALVADYRRGCLV